METIRAGIKPALFFPAETLSTAYATPVGFVVAVSTGAEARARELVADFDLLAVTVQDRPEPLCHPDHTMSSSAG